MKRKINIVFIVVFMMIISLPYVFAHRGKEERISYSENRRLAEYPSLVSESGALNQNFLKDWENWLNDNFRGRSIMVEVNAALQYRLFDRIAKSDAIQGEKPWIFVKEEEAIKEFQHLNLLSEEELNRYAENMQAISDYLADRGIAFYYFQCYDKEEIYPEKYVKGVNQIGPISQAEQIVYGLQEKTDVQQILVRDILLEHKEEAIYYQFADLVHWNERGAYYAYQVMMKTLQKDFADIRVLQEADYDVVDEEQNANDMYEFKYPYTEMVPIYSVKDPQAVEITELTAEKWSFLRVQEYTHDYTNQDCSNDLRVLLLGDSFIRMFMKDDIAESFHDTLSIDWMNLLILDEVVEAYQPDIVIFESAQGALKTTVDLVNQVDYIE